MSDDPAPILLFGGTFDPPHRGHVQLAEHVAERLACRRIVFIPAARNPLKLDGPVTSDEHRLTMLTRAIAEIDGAEISRIELDRGGASYFVDTLRALRDELGENVPLRFLVGADQALHFRRWKDWVAILALAKPAVIMRPPWTLEAFEKALSEVYDAAEARMWSASVVDAPLVDVSSTRVRRRRQRGEDIGDLVTPAVAAYIEEQGLYATTPTYGSADL